MQLWSDAESGSRVDADAYQELGVSAVMVVPNSLFAGRDGSTVPAAAHLPCGRFAAGGSRGSCAAGSVQQRRIRP